MNGWIVLQAQQVDKNGEVTNLGNVSKGGVPARTKHLKQDN